MQQTAGSESAAINPYTLSAAVVSLVYRSHLNHPGNSTSITEPGLAIWGRVSAQVGRLTPGFHLALLSVL